MSRPLASRFGCRSGAFTLLELLVVLGVIGILSSLVLGVGRSAGVSGKAARCRAELGVLAGALESYKAAHGDYPRTDNAADLVQALIGRRGPDNQPVAAPSLIEVARLTISGARDPFADATALMVDPWGQAYRYAYRSQIPWTNPAFVLWSAGPDGTDRPDLLTGGFPDRQAEANRDNIYADQP